MINSDEDEQLGSSSNYYAKSRITTKEAQRREVVEKDNNKVDEKEEESENCIEAMQIDQPAPTANGVFRALSLYFILISSCYRNQFTNRARTQTS